MATSSSPKPRPGRALLVLAIALVLGVVGMAASGTWKPKLGLDLEGGASILLKAQSTKGTPEQDQMTEAVNIIRQRIGDIAEAEVTTQGSDHILVEVPGAGTTQIRQLVGQTAQMRFRQVLAEQPATQTSVPTPTPTPTPSKTGTPGPSAKPKASTTPKSSSKPKATPSPTETAKSHGRAASSALESRVAAGVPAKKTPTPTPSPTPTSTPMSSAPAPKISTTGATQEQLAALAKFTCPKEASPQEPVDKPVMTCDDKKTTKYVLGPTLVRGNDISDASAGVPQNSASWIVQLKLQGAGSKAFADASTQMYQLQQPLNQFAIVLDGWVISAPYFSEPIPGGEAQIQGSFTEQHAQQLAQVLKYGALPLTFKEETISSVSPTLGSDQLRGGLIAGLIGLALVVLYSILYYRGLSFVIVLSLAIAAGLTYEAAVLLGKGQGFTLTLAGIAGLIVAIGITADSFVVYFERLRDEVRDGKSLRTAVETGWHRARRTILAADSISLLAAVVLYFLSIGNVRGFAYALGLTTAIDLVVVFLFTKPLLTLLARTKFFGNGHRFSGLDPAHLGITRRRPAGSTRRRAGSTRPSTATRTREA